MDPTCVFNFFTFFERILYNPNCIIFIFSWCATHTKNRSKLVVVVTAGSQKITLWGPQRTPLGILRVKYRVYLADTGHTLPLPIDQYASQSSYEVHNGCLQIWNAAFNSATLLLLNHGCRKSHITILHFEITSDIIALYRSKFIRIKNQLDATCYFIVLLIGSTCFGHYYAHHQELATIMLVTTTLVG